MKGENIICIAEVGWDRVWQRQNEVMSKLSADNRVLVVENLELRVRRQYFAKGKSLGTLAKTLRVTKRILVSVRRVNGGIVVFSPFFLPFGHAPFFTRLNVKILVRSLNRLIGRLGFSRPVFWVYLPSTATVGLISNIPHKMVVYDCSSNFPANPLASENFGEPEQEIMRRACKVFVASKTRYEEIGEGNPKFVFVPNGVDYSIFEKMRTRQIEVPRDMSSIPHPIIGYIGTLHYWIDYRLLEYLVDSHPDWSLVLIGPVDTLVDVSRLMKRHNVYCLGYKVHSEIPRYLKFFDVAVIPYRRHQFTRYVYPTKLHEYFALGKPVVSTDLPELEPYRHVVKIASNPEHFAQHIQRLLNNSENHEEGNRIEIAKENSWDTAVKRMSAELDQCL